MLDSLEREEFRRRYGRLIGEIFRRADTPTAVAVALKSMGWFGEGGNQYSDRAMNSWKGLDSYPNPMQIMALAHRFGVSIDEYAFGEAFEVRFADRVERNSRDIGWLKQKFMELAVRTGHDDLLRDGAPTDRPAERSAEAEGAGA